MSADATPYDDSSAFDESPDGVVVTTGELIVTSVNPAAVRIIGPDAGEYVGKSLRDLLPLRDDSGRDWWDCLDPINGLATRVRMPERLLTLSRADQPEHDLLVTASMIRDQHRKLIRMVVAIRDTSIRARQERSGAELVSTVAHELRSPLTSVKGFTATLLAKWERFDDEQKKLMLTTVNADADRVTRLITELLDVSRIESGRLEVRKQVIDLEAIVQRDVDARVAAGEPAEVFVVRRSGGLGEIWADPDKVAQVVGNVVENARRHGAGTVTIVITPHGAAADGAFVSVADEGEGIATEVASRVFRKFWRGNRRGGTGLGLFIAKGIIDAHGGVIEAGRGPTGGALVTFTLPAGTPDFAV